MKKPSHIQQIRAAIQRDKARVMQLLQWDDMQYAEFQELMGYEYVDRAYGQTCFVKTLTYTPSFWSWFRNQWAVRDEIFLLARPKRTVAERIAEYEAIHDHNMYDHYPPRLVFKEAYVIRLEKEATR